MSQNIFQFKQFRIAQDRCAMKVGTDGVLLGAYAPLAQAHRILDIGSGTGLLAIMAAQRNSEAEIVGVEIDADAAEQARENVQDCPWSNRIEITEISLQDFASNRAVDAPKFDLIVSNPPFFENSLKAPDSARSAARHSDSLPFGELMRCANSLLSDDGLFSLIYPTTVDDSIQTQAILNHLFCTEICFIKTLSHKPAKRLIATFSKRMPESVFLRRELCMFESAQVMSDEYRALTQDFYLDK